VKIRYIGGRDLAQVCWSGPSRPPLRRPLSRRSLLGFLSPVVLQDFDFTPRLGKEQLPVNRIQAVLVPAVPDTLNTRNPGALNLLPRHFEPLERTQPTDLQFPNPAGWV
jgi:hypothetical protein